MISLRRTFSILGFVFLLVGVLMLTFVGAYLANDYDQVANGEQATGVVLQAHDNQKPIIEFRTARGERIRIEGKISASPSPYEVGERVRVFYFPNEPADALIDTFIERWFVALLFGGFATVFLLVGGVMFRVGRRRTRRWKRLLQDGQRIQGRVASIVQNKNVKINGKHPWRVLVDWQDAKGVAHRDHSEMLQKDPSARLKHGDPVTVIADRDDPAIYWIDVFGEAAGIGSGSVTPPTGGFGRTATSSFGRNTGRTPVIRR